MRFRLLLLVLLPLQLLSGDDPSTCNNHWVGAAEMWRDDGGRVAQSVIRSSSWLGSVGWQRPVCAAWICTCPSRKRLANPSLISPLIHWPRINLPPSRLAALPPNYRVLVVLPHGGRPIQINSTSLLLVAASGCCCCVQTTSNIIQVLNFCFKKKLN